MVINQILLLLVRKSEYFGCRPLISWWKKYNW